VGEVVLTHRASHLEDKRVLLKSKLRQAAGGETVDRNL
jgi:hypothetical protein